MPCLCELCPASELSPCVLVSLTACAPVLVLCPVRELGVCLLDSERLGPLRWLPEQRQTFANLAATNRTVLTCPQEALLKQTCSSRVLLRDKCYLAPIHATSNCAKYYLVFLCKCYLLFHNCCLGFFQECYLECYLAASGLLQLLLVNALYIDFLQK